MYRASHPENHYFIVTKNDMYRTKVSPKYISLFWKYIAFVLFCLLRFACQLERSLLMLWNGTTKADCMSLWTTFQVSKPRTFLFIGPIGMPQTLHVIDGSVPAALVSCLTFRWCMITKITYFARMQWLLYYVNLPGFAPTRQCFCFQNKVKYFLDTLIQKIFYSIMKKNTFSGWANRYFG